ncbi:periplasmic binding protein-like I [Dichotomocladium elegans]|nr:periplasmic binding protein-like I [Dichotomocladium elegans]
MTRSLHKLCGGRFFTKGASAIRMAANDINRRGIIPGAYVTLIGKDSFPTASINQGAVTDAVYASITLLQQGVIGVIGDVSSSWTSLSALMTSVLEIPQCSFAATAVSFSDKTEYKYFFRTIPTQTLVSDAMMSFAATQGWSKVGIVYSDDAMGQQFCQHTIVQSSINNMQVTRYQAFPSDATTDDIANTIRNVTSGGVRIILLAASVRAQTSIMIQAAEMGYVSDDYVWLISSNIAQDLQVAVDARNHNISSQQPSYPIAINGSAHLDFNSAFNGLFMFDNWLSLDGYPPYEAFLDSWSALDPMAYPYAGHRNISTNEGLAYSCMMVMAEGFSQAVANTTNHTQGLLELKSGDLGQYLIPPAFNVGYVGPEGPMVFDSNGDVTKGNYQIYNLQRGSSVVVGQSMGGEIRFTGSLMYHDGTST